MLTRRYFMRASAIAVAGMGAAPSWLVRTAAAGESRGKILIAIFQRGAADGLNIVVPHFEKRYYDLRPTIAIATPGKNNGALDLDGRFGLHPSLQPLKPLWDSAQLAVVHAAGSPDGNRSHFEAQDSMESGTPGRTTEDGWLNRALAPLTADSSPVRAVAIGARMPRTLRGDRGAIAVSDLQQFGGKVIKDFRTNLKKGGQFIQLFILGTGRTIFTFMQGRAACSRAGPSFSTIKGVNVLLYTVTGFSLFKSGAVGGYFIL